MNSTTALCSLSPILQRRKPKLDEGPEGTWLPVRGAVCVCVCVCVWQDQVRQLFPVHTPPVCVCVCVCVCVKTSSPSASSTHTASTTHCLEVNQTQRLYL